MTVISNYVDGIRNFEEAEAKVEHFAELSIDPRVKNNCCPSFGSVLLKEHYYAKHPNIIYRKLSSNISKSAEEKDDAGRKRNL